MRFEEVKNKDLVGTRQHKAEVYTLIHDFHKSGISVAEVKDWDTCYKNTEGAYQSLRRAAYELYPGEIRVSRASGRVFIARVEA